MRRLPFYHFWQTRLNLFTRLLLGFSTVLVFALVIAIVTLVQVQSLSASFDRLYTAYNNNDLINEIHTTVSDQVAGTLDQLWSGRARLQTSKTNTALAANFARLRASGSYYELEAKIGGIESRANELLDLLNQIIKLDNQGKTLEARANWLKGSVLFQDFEESLKELEDANDQDLAEATQKANTTRDSSLIIITTCSVLALLTALSLAFVITNSTVKRVKKISLAMQQVVDDNTFQQVELELTGNDELTVMTRSFNAMIHKLSTALQGLKATGLTVSSSSQYFSEAMQRQLAVVEQETSAVNSIVISANQLRQTAFSIDDRVEAMTNQARINLNNLHLLSQAVVASSEQISKTREATRTVTSGISRMLTETGQVSEEVQELVGQLSSIQQLAAGLKAIAAETHLLALNAAIESAGAGPYGERFGVIAAAVKALADQSQHLAGNMGGFIREIESKIGNVTSALSQTDQELGRSQQLIGLIEQIGQEHITLASQMSEAIHKITQLVDATVAQTQTIAQATREQRQATEEIITNLNAVELAVKDNMHQHQTSVSAVSSLQSEIIRLNSLVANLGIAASC